MIDILRYLVTISAHSIEHPEYLERAQTAQKIITFLWQKNNSTIFLLRNRMRIPTISYRILEYLELKGIHKDHSALSMAPHSTTRNPTLNLTALSKYSLKSSSPFQGPSSLWLRTFPNPQPDPPSHSSVPFPQLQCLLPATPVSLSSRHITIFIVLLWTHPGKSLCSAAVQSPAQLTKCYLSTTDQALGQYFS